MNATIKNIRAAYNDTRRFANSGSNTGLVEFTHAVRKIAYDFYPELPATRAELYKFIQEKMTQLGWDGYQFSK